MKLRKVIRWTILLIVLLTAVLAAAVYLLAAAIPPQYQPVQLDPDQRRDVATQKFLPRMADFSNGAQDVTPFDWSVTEKDLNLYLASMEEIRTLQFGRNPGQIERAMARAGIAEPAVRLHDGLLTVMARSTQYNKVISADIAFQFSQPGKVHMRLAGVRVGRLPVPEKYIHETLADLRRQLQARLEGKPSSSTAPRDNHEDDDERDVVTKLLKSMSQALNDEPVESEFRWPLNKRWVRIDSVKIEDGTLTLHVTPTRRSISDAP